MKWLKRAIAAALAGVMAVSMMPQVWAAEDETEQQEVQATEQLEQEDPIVSEQPETPEQPEQPEQPETPQQDPVALRTDHSWFMSGYPDGRFGVNDSLTWAQTSVVLYQLLAESMGDLPCTYPDVKESD